MGRYHLHGFVQVRETASLSCVLEVGTWKSSNEYSILFTFRLMESRMKLLYSISWFLARHNAMQHHVKMLVYGRNYATYSYPEFCAPYLLRLKISTIFVPSFTEGKICMRVEMAVVRTLADTNKEFDSLVLERWDIVLGWWTMEKITFKRESWRTSSNTLKQKYTIYSLNRKSCCESIMDTSLFMIN